ncbi:hypothetical protein Rmf_17950 [Roseomonas fluvialis]|uniref:Uncharacterized protein n=1 Tax=Roseomonas fluvialis TaxID=1750527 RepID=A0ABN6NZM5_9PROT|nr:hypothetical protein Rmf_17950 [Roseomonas fluvialis]
MHDLLFAVDGTGWHEPEMKESIGYRWSGPGRFSVLRMPAPAGAGRGEARVLVLQGEALPEVAVFLNGQRLAVTARRQGLLGILDFAWDEAAMAAEGRAEFWFHAERLAQLPVPGGRMRAVGFRLSTLTLTGAAGGPAPAAEALALILGRRFLFERLAVATGRAHFAFRTDADARVLDVRLEAARLGPTAQPQLVLALQAGAGGVDLALGAPGTVPVVARVAATGSMPLPGALSPRDGLLVARLLAALPEAFGRWLDEAMAGASPDAALLALWRCDLARVARAAEGALAVALADGVDAFAIDPTAPFTWPAAG